MMQKNSPSIYASWDACLPHTGPWLDAHSLGETRYVKPGTMLYSQAVAHKNFYLIREGFVQCAMVHSSGRRLMLELMGPGSMFGEAAAFDGLPRYVDAWTLTDAQVSIYTAEEILEVGASSNALLAPRQERPAPDARQHSDVGEIFDLLDSHAGNFASAGVLKPRACQ